MHAHRRSWCNPATNGTVLITSTPVVKYPPSLPVTAILANNPTRCILDQCSEPQFTVDLRSFHVYPTHYSLRHYSTHDSEALRNWKLQGSNDARVWVTLSAHYFDTSLHQAGQCFTWQIASPVDINTLQTAAEVPKEQCYGMEDCEIDRIHTSDVQKLAQYAYRYFRVVMVNPNSSDHWFLACSGFE
uniref:E3 ubiquitin-protein ligase HECTD1 n=1 Tax=Lygus hesperus TaxID=30085 RepID=A0A0A9Y1K8_LYGHE